MDTIKLTLEYDGTAYAGWQRQPDQPTVQSVLEKVLAQITQTSLSTMAAGRTDAGVHALGQVVSFRSEKAMTVSEWRRALNGLLPRDIAVQAIEVAPENFHPRYNAIGKIYEYQILNSPYRSALNHHRVWHIPKPLDVAAMDLASNFFLGKHDFSSFQCSPTDNENPLCLIERCAVTHKSPLLVITIQADRFLKQMVRTMVGTLVEVGQGHRMPSDIKGILQRADRRSAGKTAPPHGLYLVKVLF
ncbi:MAG: tRNA pseudouridine(38-40) synthase TruA [Nitrospirota bacterium]|nr:MAG: tRNA pseudouridine(38-40) synthase TruA [Nitrospirota bacterium]